MEPDIHIRDEKRDTFMALSKQYPQYHVTWYHTLCGTTVRSWEVFKALYETDHPTCLGCILLDFQNKAEQ